MIEVLQFFCRDIGLFCHHLLVIVMAVGTLVNSNPRSMRVLAVNPNVYSIKVGRGSLEENYGLTWIPSPKHTRKIES